MIDQAQLTQVREMAKREAARTGSPQAIVNLNTFGFPTYVVRAPDPFYAEKGSLVDTVNPEV